MVFTTGSSGRASLLPPEGQPCGPKPLEETVFVLVRHAHAGNKSHWPGADDDRPLSPRGRAEALELARVLTEAGVSSLLSSPALRCLQTLEPAALALGLPVQPCQELIAEASAVDLLRLVESANSTALCTHGETLKILSVAWAPIWRRVGTAPPDLSGTPKGACWVVERYATPSATARWVAAPARA
jgi:phosphohistidine phosphatase SixA